MLENSSMIKLVEKFPASPETVFAALTDPKAIAQWSGQKGNVPAKLASEWEMFDGWVKGKVLEYDPGKCLAYTWQPVDWPSGAKSSVVKYTLVATESGTEMILEHAGFPNDEEMEKHRSGWLEHVLGPLKKYLENSL